MLAFHLTAEFRHLASNLRSSI